ncbi:23490_t:CDS:2, partial [Racocetra persica]
YEITGGSKKKPCVIGTCSVGDEGAYNAYQVKRPSESKVDRINFGATFANNELFYNDTVYKLFTSVHTGQIRNLLEIAPLEGIGNTVFGDLTDQQWVDHYKIPVAEGATLLTPLLSKMGLNFYLVRICDKDLAKKNTK